jgi:hypothetical protein
MNDSLPTTKRVGYDGITRYPVQIFITERAIRAADRLIKSKGFKNSRSRSAVLSSLAELLAINGGAKR